MSQSLIINSIPGTSYNWLMAVRTRYSTLTAYACFAGFLTFAIVTGTLRPEYDHDVLAYSGIAMEIDGASIDRIHPQVYEWLKEVCPTKDYVRLTESTPYLVACAHHPAMFKQILPFFRVKPLYVGILYTAYKFGMNPIRASVFLSILCFSCFSVIVVLWISRLFQPWTTVALSIALLISVGLLDLIGLTTPDAASSTVLLLIAYLYATRGHCKTLLFLMAGAILLRVDNAVFVFAYLILLKTSSASKLSNLKFALLTGGTLVLAYSIQNAAGYEWTKHFYNCFVDRTADLSVIQGVSLTSYLKAVLLTLRLKPPCNTLAFFALLGFVGVYLSNRASLWENATMRMSGLLVFALMVHWLVFPEPVPRFFAAHTSVVTIFFLGQVRNAFLNRWSV